MKKPKSKKKKKRRRSFALPPERKQKRKHVWLKVLPDDLWLKVRRGKTILEALQKTDVELEGDCGGLGQCGKCKVRIQQLVSGTHCQSIHLSDNRAADNTYR